MKEILDYSKHKLDTQETHQETVRNTPGCTFPCFFLPEKHPGCILCTCMHPVTSFIKVSDQVVGHTLTYTLSKFEVNQTDSS